MLRFKSKYGGVKKFMLGLGRFLEVYLELREKWRCESYECLFYLYLNIRNDCNWKYEYFFFL